MSNDWIENTGEQPVGDDVVVDVKWNGMTNYDYRAEDWRWQIEGIDDVTHWRLHKPQEEKFLEDAYDEPPSLSWNPVYGVSIKETSLAKRVSESVNILTQKNISADDVELIVDIYKRMDK